MTPVEYLKKTEKKRMAELFEFLSFPSVSAKSEHKKDLVDCAQWLTGHLKGIGFTTRLVKTKGHPLVYAEYKAGKDLPTVMYYGHYDVQPPEPLELWKTSAFKPQIRGGAICARGASDDKGQTFTHIKGLEAILKTTGTLPVNVKMLIEGEEESHSVNLPAFIRKEKSKLGADIVVVSDTSQFSKDLPAVTFGLRGIAAAELYVYGPNRDVHSGTYGGTIANPINILCQIVAQLHDKNGRVTVPGFYAGVKPVSKWLKAQYKKLPNRERTFMKELDITALHGEKGFTTYERAWDRPTLDVNGIKGGYQGEGAKTIIASHASCKITMRLVPGQDPADVCNKLEKHLKKLAPKSVRIKVHKGGGARAVVVPTDGPWLDAAARAIEKGFGKKPVFMKEGGSIPIVVDFKQVLGLDTLLIGFGQNDDNIHSPNERFRVVDFERGCRTATYLPYELAAVKR
ncbi:MAG: dipeptidase [candidate division Zixibacteria bacterium]|jgi:succinyl-diaminopimelate desuccinylase|nr:dipeptidase [candidate division Zixibacteria bacterium]